MVHVLAVIVAIVGAMFFLNMGNKIGASFKKDTTIPEKTVISQPKIGEGVGQQYGSDSDEESNQTVTDSTPAPVETPVPTPVPPTPKPTPQVTPASTPLPTQNVSVKDKDQQEQESTPAVKPKEVQKPAQKQKAMEKRKPLVVNVPRPRRITIAAPPPPLAPRQVLHPEPAVQKVRTVIQQTRKPRKLSQEEMEEIARKTIERMKEEGQ